ncbi:Tobamovirus multiplication protein 2A [Zea mays]|uniref:Tobamovirus multiplication protein 2A n=1 Tax=Zea mays TaxID=4577 RepID=A0A1D6K8Y2_MAIZE|nr:Tobamovirus multiplication protein 2A [Zea mays]
MAACRGFFECLLRLLNFILTVAGLAMVGYGIYLLVEWMKISEDGSSGGLTAEVLVSGRPLLGAVALGDSFLDMLPKAWAMNKPAEYDSDDEIIAIGRSPTMRQPLIHAQNVPATGVPVPTLDQRSSRNDAWSQRMREKYGLDTSQFTYNPSDPSRYQQNGAPQAEERSRCTIM